MYAPSYRKTLKPSWNPQLKGKKSHLKLGGRVENWTPDLEVGEM